VEPSAALALTGLLMGGPFCPVGGVTAALTGTSRGTGGCCNWQTFPERSKDI